MICEFFDFDLTFLGKVILCSNFLFKESLHGPIGNRTRISSLQTTCSTIGLWALFIFFCMNIIFYFSNLKNELLFTDEKIKLVYHSFLLNCFLLFRFIHYRFFLSITDFHP